MLYHLMLGDLGEQVYFLTIDKSNCLSFLLKPTNNEMTRDTDAIKTQASINQYESQENRLLIRYESTTQINKDMSVGSVTDFKYFTKGKSHSCLA